MSCDKTLYDLKRVFNRQTNRQWSFEQSPAKGFALEQLTDDVRRSFVETEVINGDDVGMIQCRCGTSFQFESTEMIGIAGGIGPNQFQGDVALQPFVASPENLAHGARPDFLEDSIVTYNAAIHVQGRLAGMLGAHVLWSQ
jgi:hypothetical protein